MRGSNQLSAALFSACAAERAARQLEQQSNRGTKSSRAMHCGAMSSGAARAAGQQTRCCRRPGECRAARAGPVARRGTQGEGGQRCWLLPGKQWAPSHDVCQKACCCYGRSARHTAALLPALPDPPPARRFPSCPHPAAASQGLLPRSLARHSGPPPPVGAPPGPAAASQTL